MSGKGLGGGYVPLSLVSAADHVVDPITEAGRTVMFFTYSGHDSSCAGASAVLRILDDEGLVERAAVMGSRLHDALKAVLGTHPDVAEVRGRGLMLGVELRGLSSADVVGAALARDVWVYPAGSGAPVADAVLIAPPLVIDDHHIERIVSVLAESIDSVSRGR